MRIIGAFCLAALPLLAQHEGDKKKQFIGDPKAIEAGHILFASGCAACHGSEGQGGRGPNLREKVYWHPTDDEAIYRTVEKGIPAGGMPAANLPEDQIWQVVAPAVRALRGRGAFRCGRILRGAKKGRMDTRSRPPCRSGPAVTERTDVTSSSRSNANC